MFALSLPVTHPGARSSIPVGAVCAFVGRVTPSNQGPAPACGTGSGPMSGVAPAIEAAPDQPVVLVEAMGWMLCDGRTLLRSEYPELFGVIHHRYGGAGEQFAIPDLRGVFLRGVDHGSGCDPDAGRRTPPANGTPTGVGSVQCDAMQDHVHTYASGDVPSATGGDGGPDLTVAARVQTGPPDSPARVSTETRPINVYVNYLIKFR
jgi:microcystin-dependent protein